MKDWMRPEIGMKIDIFEVASFLRPESVMVEIGSYTGESTELFCMSGRVIKIHAVDPWQNGYDAGDEASYIRSMADVEEVFDVRTARFGEMVVKRKMKSVDAAMLFRDRGVDCVYIDGLHTYDVYIDGLHTYDGVIADIKTWLPKIRFDGVIAGHDYHIEGVRRAVSELLGNPVIVCKGTSWVVKMSSLMRFVKK
jgi:hypothetical protein